MAKIQQKITTFLWFDKEAEEAATFYVSLFPNSRVTNVTRYTDAGRGKPGSVLSVSWEIDGQEFAALNGGPTFKFTEAISLVVNCADQKEIDHYWTKLLAGGGEASQCGWLKDKYGLSWQIVPVQLHEMLADKDAKKANRAMEAMLKMEKLDLPTLQRAFEGKA